MPSPKEFALTVGSKAQVYHGTAKRTAGGLVKADLMQTDKGRIVSKKAHAAGLVAIKRLRNAGYVAKKGEFKLFSKKSGSKKASVKGAVKTRAMTLANHKKAHNRAVKAWETRRAKKNGSKKNASKGGSNNGSKNGVEKNASKGGFW
jgi:hypothetical protein